MSVSVQSKLNFIDLQTPLQESADVIFSGGTIITMDAAAPRAEALAVHGGRIMAVGAMYELEGLSGSNTRLVDLDGRTMTPGLIDPHMHTAVVQLDAFVDAGIFANDTCDDVIARLQASISRTAPDSSATPTAT
jgi:predicted amidohydrolase YtcJ